MTYNTSDIEQLFQSISSQLADLAEAVRTRNYEWQASHETEEGMKGEIATLTERVTWLEGLVNKAGDS